MPGQLRVRMYMAATPDKVRMVTADPTKYVVSQPAFVFRDR